MGEMLFNRGNPCATSFRVVLQSDVITLALLRMSYVLSLLDFFIVIRKSKKKKLGRWRYPFKEPLEQGFPSTSTINSKYPLPLSCVSSGTRSVLTLHNQTSGPKAGLVSSSLSYHLFLHALCFSVVWFFIIVSVRTSHNSFFFLTFVFFGCYSQNSVLTAWVSTIRMLASSIFIIATERMENEYFLKKIMF